MVSTSRPVASARELRDSEGTMICLRRGKKLHRTPPIALMESLKRAPGHADMAGLKSEPRIKTLRIDAGLVGQEFDQPAALVLLLHPSPSAPVARRCRGCGGPQRPVRLRSRRAKRLASSIPAGCKAAGSRRPVAVTRLPRPPAGYSDRARPSRTLDVRRPAADLRCARGRGPAHPPPASRRWRRHRRAGQH